MIKVVYCDITRLILPYFPTVFTNIYYLFPLNSMTLPCEGGELGEVSLVAAILCYSVKLDAFYCHKNTDEKNAYAQIEHQCPDRDKGR